MRTFIVQEKEFINFLILSPRGQRKLVSFLDKYLSRTVIVLNPNQESAEFRFEIEGEATDEVINWVIDSVDDLEEIIAILVKLILYLEGKGYVASYKVTEEERKEEFIFGQGIVDNLKISMPFPDIEIVKLLIEYLFKEIVPLEPLKDLASHNFIPPEERRFRKQYRLAVTAILISIIIGVSVITLNIIAQNKNTEVSSKTSEIVVKGISALENINSSIEKSSITQSNELKELTDNVQSDLENINNSVDDVSSSVKTTGERVVKETSKAQNKLNKLQESLDNK